MTSCAACGARLPSNAAWCNQCYGSAGVAVLSPPEPQAASAPVPAPQPVVSAAQRWRPGLHGLALVAAAIGLGAALQWFMGGLGNRPGVEPDQLIRWALFATVGLYVTVGIGLLGYLHHSGRRLQWHTGQPVLSISVGLITGLVLGVVLTLLFSAVAGHTTSDSRVILLLSDGSASRIGACLLLTVVAAPLVEETLFRGLFAESLRGAGALAAVCVSAIAFAVWHLNPSALKYYALLGALLAGLYLKRGLLCSMAAHAAFNGTLTVVAISLVTGPGHTFTGNDGLAITAPADWSQANALTGVLDLALAGPSGSALAVDHIDEPVPVTAEQLQAGVARLSAGWAVEAQGVLNPASARVRSLPAGRGLDVQGQLRGDEAEVLFLPDGRRVWAFVLRSAGSARAFADFQRMLPTIRLPAAV